LLSPSPFPFFFRLVLPLFCFPSCTLSSFLSWSPAWQDFKILSWQDFKILAGQDFKILAGLNNADDTIQNPLLQSKHYEAATIYDVAA